MLSGRPARPDHARPRPRGAPSRESHAGPSARCLGTAGGQRCSSSSVAIIRFQSEQVLETSALEHHSMGRCGDTSGGWVGRVGDPSWGLGGVSKVGSAWAVPMGMGHACARAHPRTGCGTPRPPTAPCLSFPLTPQGPSCCPGTDFIRGVLVAMGTVRWASGTPAGPFGHPGAGSCWAHPLAAHPHQCPSGLPSVCLSGPGSGWCPWSPSGLHPP